MPLSLAEVWAEVRGRHPLWRAISLGPAIAQAEAQQTSGVWDPFLSASYMGKDFKNTLYYTLLYSDLKVPIWNGLDLKLSYERTFGFSLNPEDVTPAAGLIGAGLSVPLGQGLLIDYRRAAIQKARVYATASLYERQLAAATFLYEVAVDYWEWLAGYYKARAYAQQLNVAQARLDFVRTAFLQGEASRVDTLEAAVEVDLRAQQLALSQGELAKKTLLLLRHLWQDSLSVERFLSEYRPDTALPSIPFERWEAFISQHPKLRLYEFKRQALFIERRWAAEQLRPRLQVDYSFLRDLSKVNADWSRPFETNYKLVVTFAMPLYLRAARGQLAAARLELLRLEAEQLFEARSLYVKALGQINLLDSLASQSRRQERVVQNLFELVTLEGERFRAGESDLFVVNRREREAFSALISLYDLYARYGTAYAELGSILGWGWLE